ncbi:MAG TPA: DUF1289 domain-containing protein [Methylophilaceae bacterium]|jgi:predicted Fe-S protein YdhL (DUF1289 family)|nr:DUF1289 domain-containing protein [Methylophilaceae bacterium]
MNDLNESASPCIGVCTMNEATGFCQGCYRTIDEIRGWWDMAPEQKRELLSTLEQRMGELVDFGD